MASMKKQVTRLRVRYTVDVDFKFLSNQDPLKVITRFKKYINLGMPRTGAIPLELNDIEPPTVNVERVLSNSSAFEDWYGADEN